MRTSIMLVASLGLFASGCVSGSASRPPPRKQQPMKPGHETSPVPPQNQHETVGQEVHRPPPPPREQVQHPAPPPGGQGHPAHPHGGPPGQLKKEAQPAPSSPPTHPAGGPPGQLKKEGGTSPASGNAPGRPGENEGEGEGDEKGKHPAKPGKGREPPKKK
jgi:hypothetical protein